MPILPFSNHLLTIDLFTILCYTARSSSTLTISTKLGLKQARKARMTIASATATKITWYAIGLGTFFVSTGLMFLILMGFLQQGTPLPKEVFVFGYILALLYNLLSVVFFFLAGYTHWQKDRAEIGG